MAVSAPSQSDGRAPFKNELTSSRKASCCGVNLNRTILYPKQRTRHCAVRTELKLRPCWCSTPGGDLPHCGAGRRLLDRSEHLSAQSSIHHAPVTRPGYKARTVAATSPSVNRGRAER